MYISIIIKTFVLYFFIVVCYRIMGKKEVGQLSIIDLIVSILIAELAAMSIEEVDRSIFISISQSAIAAAVVSKMPAIRIKLSFNTNDDISTLTYPWKSIQSGRHLERS